MHDVEGETIDDVRAERDALGIQFAAQSERLRLAMAVVDAAGDVITGNPRVRTDVALEGLRRALAALDAVPGDVLAKSRVLLTQERDKWSAMAEGIETARWVGPDGEPER